MFKKDKQIESNDRLMIFDGIKVRVLEAFEEDNLIVTDYETYPVEECQEFIRPEGGRVFTINSPIQSAVEARKIRNLQKSVVLKSVFDFEGSVTPWYVWANLVLLIFIIAIK